MKSNLLLLALLLSKEEKKVVLQITCVYKVRCAIRADVTDPKYS